MKSPFIERALLSRRNCSVENLGRRVERVSMLPREHICPRTSRSIAPAETIVCPVLLIMSRYLDVRLSGQFRFRRASVEEDRAMFQQKRVQ